MDEGTAQTVKEIELTRDRLDGHLQELEEKLPAASTIKRVARLAAGGGAGTTVFWFAVRLVKKRTWSA